MKSEPVRVFVLLIAMVLGTLIAESRMLNQKDVAYYVDGDTGHQVEYSVLFRIAS